MLNVCLGEPRLLDAHDHQVQGQHRHRKVPRPALGAAGHQGPPGRFVVLAEAASRRRRRQSLVPVVVRPVFGSFPEQGNVV